MANIVGEINSGTIIGELSSSGSVSGDITGVGSVVGSVNPSTSAVRSHPELSGRDLPDQHPIGAITSLTNELNSRPSEVIPDSFIELLN